MDLTIRTITNPTEEQTKEIRKRYLTSSNLYYLSDEKKGSLEYYRLLASKLTDYTKEFSDKQLQIMQSGHVMESEIIAKLEQHLKAPITSKKSRIICEELRVATELDGELENGIPVEIKLHYGDNSFDQMVERYKYQLHLNMLLTNTQTILFGVYFVKSDQITSNIITCDKDIKKDLLSKIRAFWKDCDSLPVKEDPQHLVKRYLELQDLIPQLEAQKKDIANQFLFRYGCQLVQDRDNYYMCIKTRSDTREIDHDKVLKYCKENKLDENYFYKKHINTIKKCILLKGEKNGTK